MRPTRPLLSTLHSDWAARGWPIAALSSFRMEGEGGDGAGGSGTGSEGGEGGQGEPSDLDKLKAESRKWEDRAKSNSQAAKERDALAKQLEELQAQTLSDAEKAVKEADKAGFERGKAEARQELGAQLVNAEVKAAAAGRLDADQLATLIEGLNPAAFLAEDGQVDTDKVTKWVDGIAPKATENGGGAGGGTGQSYFDLGQGARGGQNGNDNALNGDPLVASLKAKVGA